MSTFPCLCPFAASLFMELYDPCENVNVSVDQ